MKNRAWMAVSPRSPWRKYTRHTWCLAPSCATNQQPEQITPVLVTHEGGAAFMATA